ncbi:MAG: polysaccharide deacetylase family protein [Rhodoferax sp.]|nr:polysaccharide deacetylase family protein [Rhodoferax sp.]
MASGPWTTRRADISRAFALLVFAAAGSTLHAGTCAAASGAVAVKPVYLTFDTGHMAVAPFIADVLKKHDIKVTFFAANEATQTGNGSLGSDWAAWWQSRAAEGHEFASHTYDHSYWRADVADPGQAMRFRIRPSAGPLAGKDLLWTAAQYCAEIQKAATRLQTLTGRAPLPLFRAPGGKTSPALLEVARNCGWAHVAWAPAGFLGDELPSERFPNAQLLQTALRDIRAGDILVAHLGIWSRRDPWAPAVLEPLIVGLQARGFCFATLREHPQFKLWIAQHGATPALPAAGGRS